MKANDLFGSALASAKDSVDTAKRREKALRTQRKAIMSVLRLVAPALDSVTDNVFVTAWDDNTFAVNVNMRRLEGFKDQRLAQVLYAAMCISGVKEESSTDYAELLNRDYHFTFNGNSLNVSAWVKSDSPTCRKVKTGETMKVVAEYKIECD